MPAPGLFLGMITLDVIYLSDGPPAPNEKKLADDLALAAGGPATNAAVTHAHLAGGATVLAGVLGRHPLTEIIRHDLDACGVEILDLDPSREAPPPVSSVVVSAASGDRAVIARAAGEADPTRLDELLAVAAQAGVILYDGYQPAATAAVLAARPRAPVVVDGGSWKPALVDLLPRTDYAICSADFLPPGCASVDDVFADLTGWGIEHVAISRGGESILVQDPGGRSEVAVPAVEVRDTLAAGDVLHGACCHHLARGVEFRDALARAAEVASDSCRWFGTRVWLDALERS